MVTVTAEAAIPTTGAIISESRLSDAEIQLIAEHIASL